MDARVHPGLSLVGRIGRWAAAGTLAAALLAPGAARAATLNVACSAADLIAAINTANGNGQADTLALAGGCTYTLSAVDNTTGGPNGLPVIASDITIQGNGATIERSAAAGTPLFRVLRIGAGSAVTLRNLTVQGGNNPSDPLGNVSYSGGGIYIEGGAVNIVDSTIRNNHADGNSSSGGGIYIAAGTVNITGSTLSGNSTAELGAGIFNDNSAETTILNSTISGNSTAESGGGVFNSGTISFTQTTITANQARRGGGVYNTPNPNAPAQAFVEASIIAANTGQIIGPDVTGAFVSGGFNLIGVGDDSTGFANGVANDQVGTGAAPINPLLGPLASNGGPTLTQRPLAGSPAIDKGGACDVLVDQRGVARPQGSFCDAGSVEVEVAPSPTTPDCQERPATVYVANGLVVGGPDNGKPYAGKLQGTTGNDVIVGTDGIDRINGRAGDDLICGLGGDDTIDGEVGNDTLDGGSGNDKLVGGGGNDKLGGGAGADTLDAGTGDDTLSGGADNDKLSGSQGSDTLFGEGGDDTLSGGEDNDSLSGGDGNDTLKADQGNDVLKGDGGDDRLTGGDGADSFSGGSGTDRATDLSAARGDTQDGTIP